MSTTAYKGRDVAIKIGDGLTPEEGFTAIAGFKSQSVSFNNNPVDITNIGSAGYREMLPDGGVQSMSISGQGVFVDQTAYDDLFTQSINRTLKNYQIEFGNGDRFEAAFVVSNWERSGGFDNAEEASFTLESSGTIIFTPGT